jgi:hypothetical protein
MNSTQLEVLKIVSDEAIETIAKSHGTEKSMVVLALESGHELVCNQFQKLVGEGVEAANGQIMEMAAC